MIMCIEVYICRLDLFEIYMAHDQQQNTGRVKKKDVTCQFGQEYLSLVHDVLVLLMFFLMADLT